tara:strand:+ start:118 stop:801 length:684 start_codon:yes stop_codon:yes gene_type:complete
MVNPNRFYTYAYLREDRTPYYIGKGQRKRRYQKDGKPCAVPKDKSRIIFLKQNLTEEEAFKHEIYMIAVFGRKDLGTGILLNKSNGGEGSSGFIASEEFKKKLSEIHKGKKLSPQHKEILINSRKGKSNSQQHNQLISKALTGIIRSEEMRDKIRKLKTGENNPISNWWKLTFSDGTEIILCGLTNWAKENNYISANIHHVYTKKQKRHKNIIKVEKITKPSIPNTL